MIFIMIQPPKVPKIIEAMMRMMGLGIVKAIQMMNQLQRHGGCKIESSIREFFDFFAYKSSSFFFLLQFTSLVVLFILGRESNEMKVWVLNYFSMITNLICFRYIIEIFPFCISLIGILKNKIKSLYCASCTIALPFGFHIATFFLSFF